MSGTYDWALISAAIIGIALLAMSFISDHSLQRSSAMRRLLDCEHRVANDNLSVADRRNGWIRCELEFHNELPLERAIARTFR
jgi:hypothetical protein